MKAAVLRLILVVVIATVLVECNVDQSLVLGSKGFGDRVIARGTAYKEAKSGWFQSYTFKYPTYVQNGQLITCLKVIDKFKDGTNGDLHIISGGVGYTSVELSIRTKLGLGLHYEIEVYGH